MNKIPLIVGVGEVLWDKLPFGKKIGGAPLNFTNNVAELGANAYMISAIGKDKSGNEILKEISKTKIKCLIQENDKNTGLVHVTLEDGLPYYNIVENVAWDYIEYKDEYKQLVKSADAICYGTLGCRCETSYNTITRLIKETGESTIKLFDINLRNNYYSPELIFELLGYANIFKINEDEFVILKSILNFNLSDSEIIQFLIEKYDLLYVILTNGSKNSIVYGKNKVSIIGTPKVDVSDTVGAGDAFTAGFIYSLLMGYKLEVAHNKAVALAAYVCTKNGGIVKLDEEFFKNNKYFTVG